MLEQPVSSIKFSLPDLNIGSHKLEGGLRVRGGGQGEIVRKTWD